MELPNSEGVKKCQGIENASKPTPIFLRIVMILCDILCWKPIISHLFSGGGAEQTTSPVPAVGHDGFDVWIRLCAGICVGHQAHSVWPFSCWFGLAVRTEYARDLQLSDREWHSVRIEGDKVRPYSFRAEH